MDHRISDQPTPATYAGRQNASTHRVRLTCFCMVAWWHPSGAVRGACGRRSKFTSEISHFRLSINIMFPSLHSTRLLQPLNMCVHNTFTLCHSSRVHGQPVAAHGCGTPRVNVDVGRAVRSDFSSISSCLPSVPPPLWRQATLTPANIRTSSDELSPLAAHQRCRRCWHERSIHWLTTNPLTMMMEAGSPASQKLFHPAPYTMPCCQ